ncbi:MAG: hypothetical protein V4559_00470 [Pseudomonadota bacterium]
MPRHFERKRIQTGGALALTAVFLASCATPPVAAPRNAAVSNTATHDMECMGSSSDLTRSSDAKVRDASILVFAFYLGRLSQDGLTPEQIQTGMEEIALAPKDHPEMHDQAFAEACRSVANTLLKDMNAAGARDWDKMHANPSRAASP